MSLLCRYLYLCVCFFFRQIFSIYVLKFNLSSIVIPSWITSWDILISFSSRTRFTLMSVFVSNIMNWNLPGLGFNEFTLNHFRIYPKSNLRLCNISPNIFPQEVGFDEFALSYFRICPKSNLRLCNISPNIFPQELNVLLSAKLYMSDFETEKHIV